MAWPASQWLQRVDASELSTSGGGSGGRLNADSVKSFIAFALFDGFDRSGKGAASA